MTKTSDLTITSLRWNPYVSKFSGIPYLVVNCTFKARPGTLTWDFAKRDSEEFSYQKTVDHPKEFEKWLSSSAGLSQFAYPGLGKAWTMKDSLWEYIEKFDTFWLRTFVADCAVVRAALEDLEHYQKHGRFQSIYRHEDSSVMMRHLRTIVEYWD